MSCWQIELIQLNEKYGFRKFIVCISLLNFTVFKEYNQQQYTITSNNIVKCKTTFDENLFANVNFFKYKLNVK